MIAFYTELFEYNHHYNQKIIQTFLEIQNSNKEAYKLFSHVLNAHHTWNSRINSIPSNFGIWEELPLKDLKNIDQVNYETSLRILEHKELNSTIEYKTSKGESFINAIGEILFHIINHSTYHRGQIASHFRKNGIEPLATDYIFYKRKA